MKITNIYDRLSQTPRFSVGEQCLDDCDLPADAPRHHVDCYGRSYYRKIEIAVDGRRWIFEYDRPRRQGFPFYAGLFFDRAAIPGGHLCRVPKAKRVAVLVESPNEAFFEYYPALASEFAAVLTHRSDLIGQAQFRRLSYGTNFVPVGNPDMIVGDAGKTRDLSFMGSIAHGQLAGYPLRAKIAKRLTKLGYDCFGKGLQPVESKVTALQSYRFSVAMENVQSAGYFTEKIIDCFHCATIPVYWGDPEIASFFDPRGIIQFDTIEELENILPTLNAARYEEMLPFALANLKKAIAVDLADTAGLYRRIARYLDAIISGRPSRSHGQFGRLMRSFGMV